MSASEEIFVSILMLACAVWNNSCEQCWSASWSSVASGLSDNFIKWLHLPAGEKCEDPTKPSKTLAFAVMTSLPPSAYEGQMGMNHGMGVRSQDHAIFMSRCALGRGLQSSDPVLSICFHELQIVPLPSCCFSVLQMQICPTTERVLPLME